VTLSEAIQGFKDKGLSQSRALAKAIELVSKASGRWTAKKKKIFDMVWSGDTANLPKTKISRSAKVPKTIKVEIVKTTKIPKPPKIRDPRKPKTPIVETKPETKLKVDSEPVLHGTEASLKKEYEALNPQTSINRATTFYVKLWHFFNQKHFNQWKMAIPSFRYLKDMGSSFGVRAHYRPTLNQLSFSRRLFNSEYTNFANIFQHEMCHQAVHLIDEAKGYRKPSGKRDVHGPVWQKWMRHCKLEVRRCDMNDNTVYMDETEKKEHEKKIAVIKTAQATRQPLRWVQEGEYAAFFDEKTKTWTPGIIACPNDNARKRWVFCDNDWSSRYWQIPPNHLFEATPEEIAKMGPSWVQHAKEIKDRHLGVKEQKQERRSRKKMFRGMWG
jgi:hypothetical protein